MTPGAETLIKTLSANDVGTTGGHQGGILVPRDPATLQFFPTLDASMLNPREVMNFVDADNGEPLPLSFIHYNGKILGLSSRDEFRLTGMTRYLRVHGARAGDSIELSRPANGRLSIAYRRADEDAGSSVSEDTDIIVLSGTWKTIRGGRFT